MRKIIKSSNTDQINTFRLHYFPNIPVPDEDGEQTARSTAGIPTLSTAGGSASAQRQAGTPGGGQQPEDTEAIHRQAYEKGFAQGEQDGNQAALQHSAPLMDALKAILGELDGIRSKIKKQIEREVVELALHVARKVVHHELSLSKEAIFGVVQESMNQLDDPGKISVRLNPDDLKRIQGARERLADITDNLDQINFEEDAGIDCGGCYIQTEYGDIDARIEERLRKVEEAFRAEIRASTTES